MANQLVQGVITAVNHPVWGLPEPLSPLRPLQPRGPVLLVPSHYLGDTVMTLPMAQALGAWLRAADPETRLIVLATPTTAPLWECLPEVSAVWQTTQPEVKAPRRRLAEAGIETLWLLRNAPGWAWAARELGLPQRVGFDLGRLGFQRFRGWGAGLTHLLPAGAWNNPTPYDIHLLACLQRLGIPTDGVDRQPDRPLCLPPEATQTPAMAAWQALHGLGGQPARAEPPAGMPVRVLFQMSTGSPGKEWPESHWRVLARRLQREADTRFLALGRACEAARYDRLAEAAGLTLLNLCGQTSLLESLALLQTVDWVVTLDTAMAHLAALAGVPRLVVLYGPTHVDRWQPRLRVGTTFLPVRLSLPCQPCITRHCLTQPCLTGLDPERVWQALVSPISLEIAQRPTACC